VNIPYSLTEKQRDKIAELGKTFTYAKIAKKFGVSTATVAYHVKRRKNVLRRRKLGSKSWHLSRTKRLSIPKMLAKGLTVAQISRKLGVTWSGCNYHIKKGFR